MKLTSCQNCPGVLRERMAEDFRIDVAVFARCPILNTGFAPESFVCPHGTRYWVRPTGKQIGRWRAKAA